LLVGVGAGVAGAFASSLGLTESEQHILFVVGVLLFACGCFVLAASWRRTEGNRVNMGDRSIHTESQSGGFNWTGDALITVKSPRPTVTTGKSSTEETTDGYMTKVPLRLQDGYAASNLVIVVKDAPSLTLMAVNRVGGGELQQMGSLVVDGAQATGVQDPRGREYLAVLVTANPEPSMSVTALTDVEIRPGS
jgi:hypothetical protein